MSAQHTPGPWTMDSHGISTKGRYYDVAKARDGHVYDEYDSDDATLDIENPANAALIAAAPELYEALADVRELTCGTEDCQTCKPIRKRVDAALAKAQGGA